MMHLKLALFYVLYEQMLCLIAKKCNKKNYSVKVLYIIFILFC